MANIKGGIEQLLRFQAGGSQARLLASEQQQLKAHLDDNLCLNTHIVIAYVEEPWNVRYSEQSMNHLLHRLGYVYKKPQLVPGKANIQAQKEFLVEYEALRKQQPAEAPCYFMDATHPLHNPIANYGWIKRGQDYAVKTNTGSHRLNITVLTTRLSTILSWLVMSFSMKPAIMWNYFAHYWPRIFCLLLLHKPIFEWL